MNRLTSCLAAALLLNLLPWAPAVGQTGTPDKPHVVSDEAELFSKEAKEKADAVIARIKSNFKKDLVIETVPSIPIPDGQSKDEAAAAWAVERFDKLKVDGVFVGIIVDPPKYRIRVGKHTLPMFTEANEKELEKILVGHLKAKEMDQAVTSVANFTFEMIRRNGLVAAGLHVKDDKVGTGPGAKRGDTLTVNYIGRLKDGKTFDKTTEPITFTLKEGVFIKGFEQGLVGMKAGGVRALVVPPVLAYGKEGVGDIPPGAELHFEIELVKIR
jgi:FKBP-type peptidyl-prolyl cis-trans isomerase